MPGGVRVGNQPFAIVRCPALDARPSLDWEAFDSRAPGPGRYGLARSPGTTPTQNRPQPAATGGAPCARHLAPPLARMETHLPGNRHDGSREVPPRDTVASSDDNSLVQLRASPTLGRLGKRCRSVEFETVLEYPGASQALRRLEGPTDIPVWLDNMNCSGSEARLIDCDGSDWGTHPVASHRSAFARSPNSAGSGSLRSAGTHRLPSACWLRCGG